MNLQQLCWANTFDPPLRYGVKLAYLVNPLYCLTYQVNPLNFLTISSEINFIVLISSTFTWTWTKDLSIALHNFHIIPVWPDLAVLARFCRIWQKILSFYLVFCKILNLLWQIWCAIWPIFIVNGCILASGHTASYLGRLVKSSM